MSKNAKQRTWKKSTLKNSTTLDHLKTLKLSTLRGDVMKTVRAMNVNFMTGKKGNLYDIVGIPEDILEECKAHHSAQGVSGSQLDKFARMDALNEWVAMNTVEFYNEVQLIYSLSAAYHEDNFKGPNLGFPPGFNYRFPGKEVLNGAEYVQAVMSWISDQMKALRCFQSPTRIRFLPTF